MKIKNPLIHIKRDIIETIITQKLNLSAQIKQKAKCNYKLNRLQAK